MRTDPYGQGVEWLDHSDQPDLRVMGDGIALPLAARANLRFASASARDATITSPEPGMEAWLDDVKYKTIYDGTSWVVAAAGTSSWTTLPLTTGYTHNGNNNGTAQYRLVNMFGEASVMMRGGINLSYSGGTLVNTGNILSTLLPAAARPGTLRSVNAACSFSSSDVSSLKLDAQTGGQLRLIGKSGSTPPWVSLNGVIYSL